MKIIAIVAVSENGVIGVNGGLPWEPIKDDMRRFKALTVGHAVIMGRKTWKSLPAKPLLGRANYVVSSASPLFWFHQQASLDNGLSVARQSGYEKAFLIGGERIYREGIPLCDEVYLTRVHCNVSIPEGGEVAMFADDWIHSQEFNCEILGRTDEGMATFYRYYRNEVENGRTETD